MFGLLFFFGLFCGFAPVVCLVCFVVVDFVCLLVEALKLLTGKLSKSMKQMPDCVRSAFF